MKKLTLVLTLLSIFTFFSILPYSCKTEDDETVVVTVEKDTVQSTIQDLQFKIYPTATDQFTISVLTSKSKMYKLYLKKGGKVVAETPFVAQSTEGDISDAKVKYNFSPNENYQIAIQSTRENEDTVFIEEFIIDSYKHQYSNKFTYEKLASIELLLEFDISPSRNVIYYLDYINNQVKLNRLSLTDHKLQLLDENFFSLLLRSKSDNELIVGNRTYNNHFLKLDSMALLSYNVDTRETSFIDWGSGDYGRFSRVVNNSILVTNPMEANSISLINLSDNSKKSYVGDFRYLNEYSFDHIFLEGGMLNFSNFRFETRLPFLNSNQGIVYFDEASQYYITVEQFRESDLSSVRSRMIIYKDNKVVYEQPFEREKSFNFPGIIDLSDHKLIFQHIYGYDSTVRLDGYYMLDINKKELTLLQNDNNGYYKNDFFIQSNKSSFISVRPKEIYKITIN